MIILEFNKFVFTFQVFSKGIHIEGFLPVMQPFPDQDSLEMPGGHHL